MKKLRVSFTLLSLWRSGNIGALIDFYLKRPHETTPAMEEGKRWDEIVNVSVKEKKIIPAEFGGESLIDPKSQEKWEADYSEQFEIVGVPDIYDSPTIYEIKTGNSKDSGDYANDFQISMYFLLAELLNKPVDKAYIIHYNHITKRTDRSLVWNTEFERERARNFIDTLGSEIYVYFEQNGILTRTT